MVYVALQHVEMDQGIKTVTHARHAATWTCLDFRVAARSRIVDRAEEPEGGQEGRLRCPR